MKSIRVPFAYTPISISSPTMYTPPTLRGSPAKLGSLPTLVGIPDSRVADWVSPNPIPADSGSFPVDAVDCDVEAYAAVHVVADISRVTAECYGHLLSGPCSK